MFTATATAASAEPAAPNEAKKSSWFKKDENGVLWFQQGDDGQTKYSASLVLSAIRDTIVITVTANEQHMDDALKLAKQLQTVLQKNKHTPDHIPIVAWKDTLPGVGYSFYTDGMGVGHDTLGKKGVYKPSEAKRREVLREAMLQYRILIEEHVPQGKWGDDEHKMPRLRIVGP